MRGCLAYFGDHGHVGTVQPNYGLDEVFGARESYVEFTPDISNDLMLEVKGSKIYGRFFRQDYELHGGNAVGHYANGTIAAVEHTIRPGPHFADWILSRCGLLPAPCCCHQGSLQNLPAMAESARGDNRRQNRASQTPSGSRRRLPLGHQPNSSQRTVKIGLAQDAANYKSEKTSGETNRRRRGKATHGNSRRPRCRGSSLAVKWSRADGVRVIAASQAIDGCPRSHQRTWTKMMGAAQ